MKKSNDWLILLTLWLIGLIVIAGFYARNWRTTVSADTSATAIMPVVITKIELKEAAEKINTKQNELETRRQNTTRLADPSR